MQHYTTGVNKRLTKDERSQIIIENPLDEIIIGLLLVLCKTKPTATALRLPTNFYGP